MAIDDPKDRIGGISTVRYDGKALSLAGTHTVSINPTNREGRTGLSGTAGYVEMPRVQFIEIEWQTRAETDVEEIENIRNATIQSELANGWVAVLRNAWLAGEVTINAAEGTSTARFEGMSGEWL